MVVDHNDTTAFRQVREVVPQRRLVLGLFDGVKHTVNDVSHEDEKQRLYGVHKVGGTLRVTKNTLSWFHPKGVFRV